MKRFVFSGGMLAPLPKPGVKPAAAAARPAARAVAPKAAAKPSASAGGVRKALRPAVSAADAAAELRVARRCAEGPRRPASAKAEAEALPPELASAQARRIAAQEARAILANAGRKPASAQPSGREKAVATLATARGEPLPPELASAQARRLAAQGRR